MENSLLGYFVGLINPISTVLNKYTNYIMRYIYFLNLIKKTYELEIVIVICMQRSYSI